jgi:hypothetical protein
MGTVGRRMRDRTHDSEPAAALAEQHHAERGAVRPQGCAEAGEHLLFAGEGQPGAAGGGTQRTDLLGDRQPTVHELDDLGVAGVDRAAQLTDPRRRVADGGGGGSQGVHRMSFRVLVAHRPRKTKTPRGSSGPGRLLRRLLSQR